MNSPRTVRRWNGPPLALQITALLLGGLVVAQAVTFGLTVLLPPQPPPLYQLDDIAKALGGSGDSRVLRRAVQPGSPEPSGPGWLTSERSRRELAQLLGRDESDVRLYFYTPLPFGGAVGPPPGALSSNAGGLPRSVSGSGVPLLRASNHAVRFAQAAVPIPGGAFMRVDFQVAQGPGPGGGGFGPGGGFAAGGGGFGGPAAAGFGPSGPGGPTGAGGFGGFPAGGGGIGSGPGGNPGGGFGPMEGRQAQTVQSGQSQQPQIQPGQMSGPERNAPSDGFFERSSADRAADRSNAALSPAGAVTGAGAPAVRDAASIRGSSLAGSGAASTAASKAATGFSSPALSVAPAFGAAPSLSAAPSLTPGVAALPSVATTAPTVRSLFAPGAGAASANGPAGFSAVPDTGAARATAAGTAVTAATATAMAAAAHRAANPHAVSDAATIGAASAGAETAGMARAPAEPAAVAEPSSAMPAASTTSAASAASTASATPAAGAAENAPPSAAARSAARAAATARAPTDDKEQPQPHANAERGLFGLAPAPFVVGDFVAAVRLPQGGWATVQPVPEPFPNAWQRRVALWFLVAALIVVPAGWWFSRRLVGPIAGFARAAEQLGRDPRAPVRALSGPAELGRAAQAFNRMQTQLRSFVEDRTAMIGAISHDLRTPLTRMRFRIEDVPDEVREGMLEDVEEMEQMISSVLAFIRDASEPGPREQLDLSSIVEDVVENAAFVGKDVRLEHAEQAAVDVDAIGMRRVLDNLVENAVKYGQAARVRLFVDSKDAVAEVSDSGPGLPEEELDRVFQPFYRAPAARASGQRGSGLGLAVCRSIARAHGGDVQLKRGAHGLVAQLRLPLAADFAPAH